MMGIVTQQQLKHKSGAYRKIYAKGVQTEPFREPLLHLMLNLVTPKQLFTDLIGSPT